jgi:hypothetical protein
MQFAGIVDGADEVHRSFVVQKAPILRMTTQRQNQIKIPTRRLE